MGLVLFFSGFLLLICGAIALLLNVRLCHTIMESTQSKPNSLTKTEIWMAGHVFKKRRKLRSLIATSENQNIRLAATRALWLELAFYALWIGGMIIFGLGAIIIGPPQQ